MKERFPLTYLQLLLIIASAAIQKLVALEQYAATALSQQYSSAIHGHGMVSCAADAVEFTTYQMSPWHEAVMVCYNVCYLLLTAAACCPAPFVPFYVY